MKATLVRFQVPERQRHQGIQLWEWLLRQGCDVDARAGSVLRPIAGFGRDHVLHEQKFFELAGSLTVEVELLMTDQQMQRLLAVLQTARIRLFYTSTEVALGMSHPDAADSAPT